MQEISSTVSCNRTYQTNCSLLAFSSKNYKDTPISEVKHSYPSVQFFQCLLLLQKLLPAFTCNNDLQWLLHPYKIPRIGLTNTPKIENAYLQPVPWSLRHQSVLFLWPLPLPPTLIFAVQRTSPYFCLSHRTLVLEKHDLILWKPTPMSYLFFFSFLYHFFKFGGILWLNTNS